MVKKKRPKSNHPQAVERRQLGSKTPIRKKVGVRAKVHKIHTRKGNNSTNS